jgi:uncharacterized membrane protein
MRSLEPFIVGTVFVLVGLAMRKFPPKKVNSWYGYRTPSSMRSQKVWNYANRRAALQMLNAGIIVLAVRLILSFLPLSFAFQEAASIGEVVVPALWLIIGTELAIKRRFDATGEPR